MIIVIREQGYCYSAGLVCCRGHPSHVQPKAHYAQLTAISTVPGLDSAHLNTCSIVRKFLSDDILLLDEEADKHMLSQFTMFPALYKHIDILLLNPAPSRYLVQSPYSGRLTTPGIARCVSNCINKADESF
jgi:hypothetical protein